MSAAVIIWIIAAVVFALIEAATVSLITVWFAVGSVAAAVAAYLGGSVLVQLGTFVIVSGVFLCLTRPLFKKIAVKKTQHTNADRLLGREALVIKRIDSIENSGQVKIMGQVWSAVSEDGSVIEEDAKVTVRDISGVKLVVKPAG